MSLQTLDRTQWSFAEALAHVQTVTVARRAVEAAIGRSGKLMVVPDAEMRARLKAMRKDSQRPAGRVKQRSPIEDEVSANSLLQVERFEGSLSLRMLDAGTGRQRATVNVPWDAKGPGRTADKAVYNLLQRLKRARVQMPAGIVSARRAPVAESEKRETGAADWKPEGEELAMVSFVSEPPGAMVLVDNKPVCQGAPCTKAISPGSHRVAMHMEQYLSRDESARLADGETLTWTLAEDFALLTVNTEPAGVAVTVDGEVVRAGEPMRLRPGQHELLSKDRCHTAHSKTVGLTRGERRTELLRPVVKPAGLQVLASDGQGNDVAGAEVWVDGELAGSAFKVLKVSMCSQRVEVRHGQLGTVSEALSLEERETATVEVVLERPASPESATARGARRRAPARGWHIGNPTGVLFTMGGGYASLTAAPEADGEPLPLDTGGYIMNIELGVGTRLVSLHAGAEVGGGGDDTTVIGGLSRFAWGAWGGVGLTAFRGRDLRLQLGGGAGHWVHTVDETLSTKKNEAGEEVQDERDRRWTGTNRFMGWLRVGLTMFGLRLHYVHGDAPTFGVTFEIGMDGRSW